jgi:predicted nucleic acid-binding Zn finger protein
MKFQVGDKVHVPKETNSVWVGDGEVYTLYDGFTTTVGILMTSGRQAGKKGGFDNDKVELLTAVDAPSSLQIVKIKRSSQKTGLKVYGVIRSHKSEGTKDYNFAYIRRSNFRGWICSCDNFFFTMFKKNRNCKHIKFVRAEVGRYASKA